MKTRSDVWAIGIRKLASAEEVWPLLEEMNQRDALRERASYYLISQFISGEVFHVDSLVENGKVVFAGVNKYGRPPLQVAHGGGAYISQTIESRSHGQRKLLDINRRLIRGLGMATGAAHARFIQSEVDHEV